MHLQRPDQDAAGASAQEGALARSRAGDDRGQEPGEERRTVRRSFRRRPSVGGIGFSARPNVEKDRRSRRETFILESFKDRWSDLPRKARKRGGTARHPRLHQDNIPVLVARDRKGATFDAVLLQVDSASVGSALAGVVTAANHLIGDGGKAIAAFAREAGIAFHAVPSPGKPTAEAAHSTSRTSTPTTAELSRMATRPRSLGRPTRPPNLDQGRHRKRPILTVNAIRAKMSGSFTTSKTEGFMKALVAENDDRISRLHQDRRSGRRIGGRCAHGDDGGPYTGRRLRPSDHGRGTGLPFLEHAGSDQRLNANRRRQRSALSRLR
jgi:hypothetical protein